MAGMETTWHANEDFPHCRPRWFYRSSHHDFNRAGQLWRYSRVMEKDWNSHMRVKDPVDVAPAKAGAQRFLL